MKLGLITDIHEQVEPLRRALDVLHREQVDQIVMIGDVCETGERLAETCALLAAAGAIGVWGNHDFGVCQEPDVDWRPPYPAEALRYLATLQPRLELAGMLFTHVEPWLDTSSVEGLWYYDGIPDTVEKLERIFAAGPHCLMFAGHYHRWLQATPAGLKAWRGETPVRLTGDRYFVVIGALCEGRFATLDTESRWLVPYNDTSITPRV